MARPLPDPVLFLDECLGTKEVSAALQAVGAKVEVLLDHFASGCPDEEWLPEVGAKLGLDPRDATGWVALTKDKWIRRRPAEMAALQRAGVAAFVLSSKELTGKEMGAALVSAYPKIRGLLRNYMPPFVAAVDKSGAVKLLTTPQRRASIRRSDRP